MSLLESFGEQIWIATGPCVYSAGFRYPTRMVLIRLGEGGLFVCSPVALSEPLRAAVDALGPVRFIVAPNGLHDLAMPAWRAAYPRALAFAAPGQRKPRQIGFDATLGDAPAPGWAQDIDQAVMGGNLITTEVVFFHRPSRSVLFTDLLQNFPHGWFTGWRAMAARLDGMLAREPRVPQKFRLAFTDRNAARQGLRKILSWPAERVLMAHGEPVRADGQAFLKRAFGWMGGDV